MSSDSTFENLQLRPELLSTLTELNYNRMTPVQEQALPLLLAGKDLVARAQTGSGKTAAFGLGLLNKLDAASFNVQALVLCPTRELGEQVCGELRRLARGIPNIKVLSLSGGVPLGPQMASLQHHPHVLVATPGRLIKHLSKGTVHLKALQTLVLDEADRMLDMGFADELNEILKYVPARRQTLLFSATYPDSIAAISATVQRDATMVDVTGDEQPAAITQYWCAVSVDNRGRELIRALRCWGGSLNLVFCNTKNDCAEVAEALSANKIAAVALHGDLDQPQRTRVLVRFANRSASVLVATDVAARGLDIDNIDTVFNFELPPQPEVYVHRIGRTGRAGKKGLAISLVEPREQRRLEAIKLFSTDLKLEQRDIRSGALTNPALEPAMTTIQISGGRKNKLRPGDLLGALTAQNVVPGNVVGAIDLFDNHSYVAVMHEYARKAMQQLANRPIKGRQYRVRFIR